MEIQRGHHIHPKFDDLARLADGTYAAAVAESKAEANKVGGS